MSSVQVDYRYAKPPVRPIALPAGTGLKIDEGAPDGRLFPAELLARAYRGAISRAAVSNGFQYRSEEHTSELQSLMRISYAVLCLKKNIQTPIHAPTTIL